MNGTVFGYKKADNYAYEDGKQDTVAYELPAFLRASCVGREADAARGYSVGAGQLSRGRSCPAYLPGSLLELPFVSGRLPA